MERVVVQERVILARRFSVKRLHHVMDWEDALVPISRVEPLAMTGTTVHQGTYVMEKAGVLARAIPAR